MQGGDNEEAHPPVGAFKSHASPKANETAKKSLKSGSSKATSGTTSPAKSASANSRSSLPKTSPAAKNFSPTKKTARATLHGKAPEDLLNEIVDLKKALSMAKEENNSLKTKLRRAEDESNRKTESQKNSTNSTLNNLKRRIEKLEMTLKDKESQIKKMQSDVRATRQESFRRSSESPSESSAKRLQGSFGNSGRRSQVSHGSPTTRGRNTAGSNANLDPNAAASRDVDLLKMLLRRVLCINEDAQREYESMSNLELIAEINRLKGEIERNQNLYAEIQKLRDMESTSLESVKDWQGKEMLLRAEIEKLTDEVKSLKADRSAFYDTMEKKDSEFMLLKEELEKIRIDGSKTKLKQTSSPTGNRRSVHSVPVAKVPALRTTTTVPSVSPSSARTQSNAREVSPKQSNVGSKVHPNSAPMASTNKKVITKQTRTSVSPNKVIQTKTIVEVTNDSHHIQNNAETNKSDVDEGKSAIVKGVCRPEVEQFRQNLAAKKIQKSWKTHRPHVLPQSAVLVDEGGVDDKLRTFQENHAAKVIQKGWRTSKKLNGELDVDEVAVVTIQSTARGHSERIRHLESLQNDVPENPQVENKRERPESPTWKDDLDESATIIQAAARGHFAREEMMRKWEGMNGTGTVLQD